MSVAKAAREVLDAKKAFERACGGAKEDAAWARLSEAIKAYGIARKREAEALAGTSSK